MSKQALMMFEIVVLDIISVVFQCLFIHTMLRLFVVCLIVP